MTGFKILEDITIQNYQTELTLDDINNIVDAFANRKDITTARHALKFSREVISAAYKDIQEVANTVYKLMNGVSVKVKETINEDGSITPAINYAVPQTTAELKAWTWELIVRDFDQKVAANYSIEDIADLQSKAELVVDKTIHYSKADGTGDWVFFASKF